METQSATPLLNPVRIETPDARPVLVFRKPARASAKKRQPKRPARCATNGKYSVEQAFDYFYGETSYEAKDALNDERAIRAVAFLLTYCSEHANQSIDGNVANGLARILELRVKRSGR